MYKNIEKYNWESKGEHPIYTNNGIPRSRKDTRIQYNPYIVNKVRRKPCLLIRVINRIFKFLF